MTQAPHTPQSKSPSKHQPVDEQEPMPCLGYTGCIRIENGVRCCMGCNKPLKDHPVKYRTQAIRNTIERIER